MPTRPKVCQDEILDTSSSGESEKNSPASSPPTSARTSKLSELNLQHHNLFAPRHLANGGSEGEWLAAFSAKARSPLNCSSERLASKYFD